MKRPLFGVIAAQIADTEQKQLLQRYSHTSTDNLGKCRRVLQHLQSKRTVHGVVFQPALFCQAHHGICGALLQRCIYL